MAQRAHNLSSRGKQVYQPIAGLPAVGDQQRCSAGIKGLKPIFSPTKAFRRQSRGPTLRAAQGGETLGHPSANRAAGPKSVTAPSHHALIPDRRVGSPPARFSARSGQNLAGNDSRSDAQDPGNRISMIFQEPDDPPSNPGNLTPSAYQIDGKPSGSTKKLLPGPDALVTRSLPRMLKPRGHSCARSAGCTIPH